MKAVTNLPNLRHYGWQLLAVTLTGLFSMAQLAGRELRVPGAFPSIQAAINAARAGDVVMVEPGQYRERLKLRPGIVVRSAGGDVKGQLGLTRAEATILNHPDGQGPGVTMAEGATLDGFTITGVGKYDEALWNKHHATKGNEQKHQHIGEAGTAGIEVRHSCVVENNIVHHVGYTGIGITGLKGRKVEPRITHNICHRNMGGGIGSMSGSTALIENNTCFENFFAGIGHNGASPTVRGNLCYGNIRAGIGISEGSSPTVTGNRCFKNRRAGIGIRSGSETRPLVADNDCYENEMAGIGTKEHARPTIRSNRCFKNKLAGIGCQEHAAPQIEKNTCRENALAGIGVDGAEATITQNRCEANRTAGIGIRNAGEALIRDNHLVDNALVAVGIRNGSRATLSGNTLKRKGGMPPLMAVLENSEVVMRNNILRGGGVAAVLLHGTATLTDNEFLGNGPRKGGAPNFAVWVRAGSSVDFSGNTVERWRHALHATGAQKVKANGNQIRNFLGAGIVAQNTKTPVEAMDNIAYSAVTTDRAVRIEGPAGNVRTNRVEKPKKTSSKHSQK